MREDHSQNLLRSRRIELAKSQNDMAQMLKLSPQTIWAWEHDRVCPQLNRLDALCDAYDVTRDVLVDWLGKQMVAIAMSKRGVM